MYYSPWSNVKFCYRPAQGLDFGPHLCHTKGMKNEIEALTSPPLPVGPALVAPAPEVIHTGLEWLTDEAFWEDWELNRHDRALFSGGY